MATKNTSGIAASTPIVVKGNAMITTFAEALNFLKVNSSGYRMRSAVDDEFQTVWKVGDEVVVGKNTKNVHLRVLKVDPKFDGKFGDPVVLGLVLYETVIIAYHPEFFTTNSGGHLTPTTCTRLNQFTPSGNFFGCQNRVLLNCSVWADEHANRFLYNGKSLVTGYVTPAPRIKRHKSNESHGTLRWKTDSDGHVYSFNSMHKGEFVFPLLMFNEIGENGDFTGPLPYKLVREKISSSTDLYGLYGVSKTNVPLDLVNAHRELWNMPIIELVRNAG